MFVLRRGDSPSYIYQALQKFEVVKYWICVRCHRANEEMPMTFNDAKGSASIQLTELKKS